MAQEIVAGIDWASEAKNRALVVLTFETANGSITVSKAVSPLPTADAIAACNDTSKRVVAIDIPFGWPKKFTNFVSKWCPKPSTKQSPPPTSRHFRHRITDIVVHDSVGKCPLSVSSDRIALGAGAWTEACLENSLGDKIDVTGDGPAIHTPQIIEVYPAATLAAFARGNLPVEIEGYKAEAEIRRSLVDLLCQRFRIRFAKGVQLDDLVATGNDSDLADAFIAALTALIYLQKGAPATSKKGGSNTGPELDRWVIRCPDEKEKKTALEEGWIFFPILRSVSGDTDKQKASGG